VPRKEKKTKEAADYTATIISSSLSWKAFLINLAAQGGGKEGGVSLAVYEKPTHVRRPGATAPPFDRTG